MINHDILLRSIGINTVSKLKSIHRHPVNEFQFSKNSVWHHLGKAEEITSDPFFSKAPKVVIEPVVDFVTLSEKVIIKKVTKADLYRTISLGLSGSKDIGILRRSLGSISDVKKVVIETYEGFFDKYVFKETREEKYLKTLSYLASVMNKVSEIASYSERNQFVPIDINKGDKANRTVFTKVMKDGIGQANAHLFYSVDQCLMLELMKFTMGNESIFSKMNTKTLSKLNFVFRGSREEVVLNMARYLRMLDTPDNDEGGQTIAPLRARNTLIKMNLVLGTEDPEPDFGEEDDDEITEEDADEETSDDDDYDEKIHNDINTLETISRKKLSSESIDIDASDDYDPSNEHHEKKTLALAKDLLDKGVYTANEYNRIASMEDTLSKIKSPDGKGTLKDYISYGLDDLRIEKPYEFEDRDSVLDKGLLQTTLKDFDSKYIKEYLHKDAIKFALGIQNAGIIVKDLKVEEHEDIANHWHQFTMSIELVPGGPQTISFPLPVFDERGVTEVGGVNYYLKKQDGEMPIRKVKKNKVALTSYYGKLFIDRSDSVAYSYSQFIGKYIRKNGLSDDNNVIDTVKLGSVFYKHAELPRSYTAISETIISFKINSGSLKTTLFFDYLKRKERFGEDVDKAEKLVNGVVIGKIGSDLILMDMNDDIYRYGENKKQLIGPFTEVLAINTKIPSEYATVNIFGKDIPIVFLLGYKLGLGTLCKRLGVKPRKVPTGGRLDMGDDEYRIRFKNESWIFKKKDKVASLIFQGFTKYEKHIARYSSVLYKDKDVYSLLLDDIGASVQHFTEIKVIYDMFIDHITEELLKEMKEPTDMVNLLIRSCELLTIDSFPDEGDGRFMRVKGYERIAASVYSTLVKSVREMYRKNRSKRSRINFNPVDVKMRLLTDPAKEIYDEINPFHCLKQQEISTLTGHGGRSSDAVSKNIKGFHHTDLGIKSEATVDSGNVGVVTYLSANPKFTSYRGTRGVFDKDKDPVSSLVSTTYLMRSALDQDDMKRALFSNIQSSHIIPCKGYEVCPLVTGYEQVMPQRCDDLFSYVAENKGKITKLNKRVIEVTYEDGTKRVCKLGIRHGKSKGELIPHEIVTDLKLGDKVSKSDPICYNKGFTEVDPLLGLSTKFSTVARVAYFDDNDTHEDSLAISSDFCEKMTARHSVMRDVIVDFDKSIHDMVSVGDHVEIESKLLFIEEGAVERTGSLNEQAVEILSRLGRNAPSARHSGVIDKIEVRYRGDMDLMSPTLRELCTDLDRELARDRKESNKKVITNQVDETFRVNNNPIDKNQAVIFFYISENVPTGTGDKFILGNQMKATNSRVIKGKFVDENDEKIDMKMAVKAYNARKVNSIKVYGTMIECVHFVQDKLIEMLEE